MRLPLSALEVFTAIARQGSLRAAADLLGIKPSTVSHQLRALESRIGATLFIRTTRSLNLTDAGRALLRGAGPAFDQLIEAVENAKTTGHTERGSLRLTMPEFVYQLLIGPALDSFCQRFPAIELEISQSDALTDILSEELHAGFRLGDRIAQDMVAVRLTAPLSVAVMASPDYLATHGVPQEPKDLLKHNCIRYRFKPSGAIALWDFLGDEGEHSVLVKGCQIADSLSVSVDLARRGLGLVYTFRDLCSVDLQDGALVPVLEKYLPKTPGIFIYFPREYRSVVPLRLMIDHLKKFRSGGP